MELQIERVEGVEGRDTLVLTGAIDLVTRQDVVAAGRAVLESGRGLSLDMGAVNFIDSTGIGAIVELHNVARTHGTSLEIPRRSDRVERILEVTGMADSWVVA